MEEINGGRPASSPKGRKRPNPFVRFLAFLVTLALVLGAVALVANYDKMNFDSIKRWFSYRTLARSDSGQAESFSFDGDSDSIFASVGGDLLVCSPNSLQLYSGSGQLYVNETISMENPAVDTAGETALIYDVGGEELLIYASREEAFSLTQETGQSILSASLNRNGWLAVVSQQSGFKGAVTIYDSDYATPLIQISRSDRFVMDAVVSPDNRSVAVLTMGLTDGSFESRVECYALARTEEDTEPDWSCPVGGDAILALRWNDSGIWALGDTGLVIVSPDGTLSGAYDYGGRYLKAFSLDGEGTAALLLGKYRAGSTAELVLVGADGAAQAALDVNEQILSLSAAGRYVGVLTADRLDVYNQSLESYSTLDGTQGAQSVLLRDDGSAMLISSHTAHLYVPQ